GEARYFAAVSLEDGNFGLGLVEAESRRVRAAGLGDLLPFEVAQREEQARDLDLPGGALGWLHHAPVVVAATLQHEGLAADRDAHPLDLLHVERRDHALVAQVPRPLGEILDGPG